MFLLVYQVPYKFCYYLYYLLNYVLLSWTLQFSCRFLIYFFFNFNSSPWSHLPLSSTSPAYYASPLVIILSNYYILQIYYILTLYILPLYILLTLSTSLSLSLPLSLSLFLTPAPPSRPPQAFAAQNTSKQAEQCLRTFDLQYYRDHLSNLAVWIFQGIIKLLYAMIRPLIGY